MPRRVKGFNLESKDARRKLKPRGRPYYKAADKGLHIGYRRHRPGVAGTWSMRRYMGEGRYDEQQLGTADDNEAADGRVILDYWAAVAAARKVAEIPHTPTGPYKVKDAIADYCEHLRLKSKSANEVSRQLQAHALPALGNLRVAELTAQKISRWHAGIADKPARLRTRPGEKQRYRPYPEDEEGIRRRRVTANRCLQYLKAALNHAFTNNDKVADDKAWRKVKLFKDVDVPRVRFLTLAECKRLLNACDPTFRNMVRAALETGARYGELTRLTVADFDPDSGGIHVRVSKAGKSRHVKLTPDGQSFFRALCAGRPGKERMLLRDDGQPWAAAHQRRPMLAACERAKIDPPIGFHGLRHTWASLSVKAKMPLLLVAKNLGHADTRMVERHYGHIEEDFMVQAIRDHAPRFGKVKSNVRSIDA